MSAVRRAAPLAGVLLAACAATSNPAPSEVRPVAPAPKAQPAAVQPSPAVEPRADAKPAEPAPSAQATPAAPPVQAGAAPQGLVIGAVGGEPIDAALLLERLWMRDSQSVKEQFEFLTFTRIAMLEADRLGVRVSPDEVDLVVQRTVASVTERLKRTAPGTTLDQFVARVLQLDRASYDRKVRSDAVLQLLTERCVRAWFLSAPRRDLEMIELADDAALKAAQTALAAGTPFDEVARLHGLPEDAAAGGLRMTLARNEESDLARLAFVTPLGEVGGPVVRDEHFLLVRPVREPEVVEGPWSEVAERVEASLVAEPIDASPMQMEYTQWRAAMMRRYPVDFGAFFDLVRSAAP